MMNARKGDIELETHRVEQSEQGIHGAKHAGIGHEEGAGGKGGTERINFGVIVHSDQVISVCLQCVEVTPHISLQRRIVRLLHLLKDVEHLPALYIIGRIAIAPPLYHWMVLNRPGLPVFYGH